MFYKKNFHLIFTLILSFLVSTLMIVVGGIENHNLTSMSLEYFLQQELLNWTGGFFMAMILPLSTMGDAVAYKLGIKDNRSLPAHLISTLVSSAVMIYPMGLMMIFYDLGLQPLTLKIWIPAVTPRFIVGYFFLLITVPLCVKITQKLCTKPEPDFPTP